MKWEMHTYYNNEINGHRIVNTAREGVAYTAEDFAKCFKQMRGKEHSLKDPVALFASCSKCHKSYNGMENRWEDFLFCPHCGEKVEGIDEESKIFSPVLNKRI